MIYVRRLHSCTDVDSLQVLKQYENKLSSLTTDTLRGIAYEILSSYDVDGGEEAFNNRIGSSSSHVRIELNNLMLELKDKAADIRHRNRRKRQEKTSEFSNNTDASA